SGRALLSQAQAVPGDRHPLRQDQAQRPGRRPPRRFGDPPQLRTRPSPSDSNASLCGVIFDLRPTGGAMQDRPTSTELLAAVREFLQREIVPTLGDHRQKFRALIAANVLGVVERELAGEEERLRAEWARLGALLGGDADAPGAAPPGTLDELRAAIDARKRALCARIQAGEVDDGPWRLDVLAYARWAVEEKLRVA